MPSRRTVRRVAAGAAGVGLLGLVVVYLPDLVNPSRQYDGRSARAWTRALTSPDPSTRHRAMFALGAIGADAPDAVPTLAAILTDDPDPVARAEAGLALFKMAPASKTAVPALAKALSDDSPRVRMNAANALLRLGADAGPAVPALAAAAADEDNQTGAGVFATTVQGVATLALGRAGAGNPDAVGPLTAVFRSAITDEMRTLATRALGDVGPAAAPAAPLLRTALKDPSPEVREAAADALKKVGADPAGPVAPPDPGGVPDDLSLPVPEREYVWEIEHHGNLLVKHGFGPLADALKKADAAALTKLLADDFAGADLRDPRRVRAPGGYVEAERLEDAGKPPVALTRDAFIARMLAFRMLFPADPPQVKLALMTLSPKSRGALDGPWVGTAQLRLAGEHAKGAPAEVVVTLRYEVPRPTKENLDRPGWLKAGGVQQVLTAKAPSYLFADVTKERGIDPARFHDNWTSPAPRPTPGGVFVTDYDRDGYLDVLVTDYNGAVLYRGRPGGKFEDVTARAGIPGRVLTGQTAAWADLDGDGWDDLIVSGRVYRNEGDGTFTDVTDRCNLPLGDGGNVVVADYDRDGRLDLYITRTARPGRRSWLDGRGSDAIGNRLFHNDGNWQFTDVTKRSGTRGGYRSSFTAAWLDADNDGWPDLHVVNEFGDGALYVNNRDGTFTPRPLADRPADFGTMGLAAGDVDNDGNIDIYCANMYSKAGTRVIANLAPDAYPLAVMAKLKRFVAGSQLHLNKGGAKFEQAGPQKQVAAVGWAYGPCLADFDGDGLLDIYAPAGFISRDRNEPDG